MGFLEPSPPPFDLDEWRSKPYLERLKPNAQDWAVNGFGTPTFVYLLYVVKLIVFAVGAFLVIAATTPGTRRARRPRRLVDRADRLPEARRLDCCSGRSSGSARARCRSPFRFVPADRGLPLLAAAGDGAAAAVARQGAADRGIAADDPRRRPLRRRDRGGASTCCSPTASRSPGSPPGGSTRPRSRSCSALWGLLGLRDKVPFLAARPEVYGFLLAGLAVPAREPDRRLAARVRLHLVGRRGVEAQPPLPVRDRGDGLQHALEPRRGR